MEVMLNKCIYFQEQLQEYMLHIFSLVKFVFICYMADSLELFSHILLTIIIYIF